MKNSILVIIVECVFFEEDSSLNGGAIYLDQFGNTSIIKSIFSNNFAPYGGAMYFFYSQPDSVLKIRYCVFVENNARSSGGSIYSENFANLYISNTSFSNNFANFAGALMFLTPNMHSILEITESVFMENNAIVSGGAIYLSNISNTILSKINCSKNFAGYGGVIYLLNSQPNAILNIVECFFIENTSTDFGGAIIIKSPGNSSIIKSNFLNNLADSGALYVSNSVSNSITEITECIFIENNATTSAGAIYIDNFGNISIIHCNFFKNVAASAAAICLGSSETNSMFKIIDSVFIENNSPFLGGAIYMQNYGKTSINRSNFSNNFATSGAAIYFLKSNSDSMLEILDCAFIENNSTMNGGAIYMRNSGNSSIMRSIFKNNFAAFGAGIYNLNQCIF